MADRIEPFAIAVDQAALDDLRDRLRRTRWPERETVDDWSQGVPLAYLRELRGYWSTRYDWRAAEARLNRIPQFTTTIDGLRVHFLHVRWSPGLAQGRCRPVPPGRRRQRARAGPAAA